jgi:hypothetical protein
VFVALVATDGLNGTIEVVDSGSGMSPEFVRTGLFKPFVSSKPAASASAPSRRANWSGRCAGGSRSRIPRRAGHALFRPSCRWPIGLRLECLRSSPIGESIARGRMMADRAKPKLLIVEDDPGLQAQLKWAYDDFEVSSPATAIAPLPRCGPKSRRW